MAEIKGSIKEQVFENGTIWRTFYCPGCAKRHTINETWEFDGNYDAPTFSPSVLTQGSSWENRTCHSFIRGGLIEYLTDCTHELAGQVVPLPKFPDN
jgi:hypothetical protein